MLILKYFLVVGVALTVGLIALSGHLTSAAVTPVVVRAAPVVVPPPAPDPEPVIAAPVEQPPQKPAKASRRSNGDRGKRHTGGVASR